MCPRPGLIPAPVPSRAPAHACLSADRSAYPRHYPGPLLPSASLRTSLRASYSTVTYGWLPAPALPERALGGFPRSACLSPACQQTGQTGVSIFRDLRPVLPPRVLVAVRLSKERYFAPCPSYRVDTTYESTTWPNGDKFPFGPAVCLSRQLAVRQVATHDAYVPSSKILSFTLSLSKG